MADRIERFFDFDYQRELNEHFGGPLMYLIDECQMFFPKRTSLPNTEAYLQRHRHLGHNLYLATQAVRQVNANVVCLVELEYFAAARTKSLFGEFRYHVKTPNSREALTVKSVRPQKRIFELYKSFDVKELQKPRKVLLRKLWPVLLLPVAAYLLFSGLGKIGGSRNKVAPPVSAPAISSVKSTPAPAQSGSSKESLEKIAELKKQVDDLQKRLYDVERVQLMVVEHDGRRLTVDPDTQAVVELKKLKHKVICVNNSLTCYYDRPINSGVKVANPAVNTAIATSLSYGGFGSFPSSHPNSSSPKKGVAGPGSFADADLVPPPYDK